jgi:chromosomal replication initiation ATPase DnaA
MTQEIFDFHKTPTFSWSDFVESEENRDAVLLLAKWPNWSCNGCVIYGDSGVGKTHLAGLWCQVANASCVLKSSLNYDPRILFDTECNFLFDDFEDFLMAGNYDWIFHFLNIANEKKRYYLLLSRQYSSLKDIPLDDLRSRLLTLAVARIQNPQDELLFKIAKKISRDLLVQISDSALQHLLHCLDRDTKTINNALILLDKLALQQHKNINTQFVNKYLNALV